MNEELTQSAFLMTMTLALALAVVTWWAGRRARRFPAPVETAEDPAWWRNKYYWYRLPNGLWSWDWTDRHGNVEYGPLFPARKAYEAMDHRWIIWAEAEGGSVTDITCHFRDVVCYYPRPRPDGAPWPLDE